MSNSDILLSRSGQEDTYGDLSFNVGTELGGLSGLGVSLPQFREGGISPAKASLIKKGSWLPLTWMGGPGGKNRAAV